MSTRHVSPRLALRTALIAGCLAVARPSAAQDTVWTRVERVTPSQLGAALDTQIVRTKHHVAVAVLGKTFNPRILLSIDSITPSPGYEGDRLRVTYTVTNVTLSRATGTVRGTVQGALLTGADGTPPTPLDLLPGHSATMELVSGAVAHVGSAIVSLNYRDVLRCQRVPDKIPGRSRTTCVAGYVARARDERTITRNPATIDDDGDGVADAIERELLARFRPFYRFSMSAGDDETARPADVEWFVRHSEMFDHQSETASDQLFTKSKLSLDPLLILTATSLGPSTVAGAAQRTEYYLNPDNAIRGGESDWATIRNNATGLYGHVVALREDTTTPSVITGYKIEYWQFYAFNPVPGQIDCYSVSDSHEADWEGVELIVQADRTTPRTVRHHVHSDDVVFDLSKGAFVDQAGIREYRGTATGRPYAGYIDLHVKGPAGIGWAQNNLVRFFCDAEGCTHPVVYIEHGGHASWPTEHWAWPGVLNHDGNSPNSYLVAVPPNVGEIGKPMPNCIGCALVVGFNGHWGACGGDPPDGPPLKSTWGKPY